MNWPDAAVYEHWAATAPLAVLWSEIDHWPMESEPPSLGRYSLPAASRLEACSIVFGNMVRAKCRLRSWRIVPTRALAVQVCDWFIRPDIAQLQQSDAVRLFSDRYDVNPALVDRIIDLYLAGVL